MKKFKLFLVAVFAFGGVALAQKPAKIEISTPTIQCGMCVAKIEKTLFKQPGINTVKVDLKKKTTTVTYIPDRTNPETIRVMIANAGYDADDEAAEPTAYKKLPKCCKKPEQPVETE